MFTTMEARMMRLQAKVQGLTKQTIGQMIGDDKVVLEGEEEQRQAERKESVDTRQGNELRRGRE
jgi:uncharacterized protein YjbJ (UPF0337 family)